MRIAIISDIHEDYITLESASAALKKHDFDLLVCLGDITGFAPQYYSHKPDANICLDWIREYADIVIPGNHDLYSVGRLPSYHTEIKMPHNWYSLSYEQQKKVSNNELWLYENEIKPPLSDINRDFLKNRPEIASIETDQGKILLSHFIFPDYCGVTCRFPLNKRDLNSHYLFMQENGYNLSFVGHAHPNGVLKIGRFRWSFPSWKSQQIKNSRLVICPPLVNGHDFKSFMIYNTETKVITPITL